LRAAVRSRFPLAVRHASGRRADKRRSIQVISLVGKKISRGMSIRMSLARRIVERLSALDGGCRFVVLPRQHRVNTQAVRKQEKQRCDS